MIWGEINTKIGKARLFIKKDPASINSTEYTEDILDRLEKPLCQLGSILVQDCATSGKAKKTKDYCKQNVITLNSSILKTKIETIVVKNRSELMST